MTAARIGKTTILENIDGYCIDYDPSPMLIVFPTDRLAQRWSKINLDPMVRDNPSIQSKVAQAKSRDKNNEILFKMFTGGLIVMGGANAPTSLSMYSMRIVGFEEVDRYPPSAGIEGDPIELGRQRAANFLNRKYIYNSTPTVKGLSRIESLWNESDQRLYFVPCPFCRHYQILVFGVQSQFKHLTTGFLKFDKDNLSWAHYECSNCKQAIGERHKIKMVREGEWRKMRPEVKHHAGFHINRLYSPWTSWKEIAKEFIKTEKRRERLRVFVNTILGETWIEQQNYEFDFDGLLGRREPYEKIPRGVIILTAGVDVQDNRLECIIEGWGLNEENWFIERRVIRGSPAYPETWKMLDAYLAGEWHHENGYIAHFGEIGGLLAVGIDTGGHHTKEAYEYVKHRVRKRFFGIKGMGGFGKTFIKQSSNKKIRSPLFLVGVDAGKQLIYDRLAIQRSMDNKPTPGYLHFNMHCDKDFFTQLTSEKPEIRRVRGVPTKMWVLPEGLANEVLDCKVYNLAAYTLLNPKMETLGPILERRMEQFEKNKETVKIKNQPTPNETESQQPKPRRHSKYQIKNW